MINDKDKNIPFTDDEFDALIQDGYQKEVEYKKIVEENKRIDAEIRNQQLKTRKKEIEKTKKIKEELEEEDIFDRKFDKSEMLKSIEDRKKAVIFLNKKISKHVIIAPGSLTAVCSMTNNGKSTFVAHMAEAMINENKIVLILSNEETEEDVRARISCLRMNVSFGDYKANKCSESEYNKVLDDAERLDREKKLIVISSKNEKDAYTVTTVEGVVSVLKKANEKVDAVIIDYYNNVNISETGLIEPWHVNNRLATELNNIKGMLTYPIVVMAQCDGIKTDKKVEDKGALDYDSNHPMYRWKGGKQLLIFATDIIELTKDFQNSCSFLFCHKVRFSHGEMDRLHVLPFDKKMQRFVDWTPEFDASVTASKVVRETKEKSVELGLDKILEDK